jgi:hypothetical protein
VPSGHIVSRSAAYTDVWGGFDAGLMSLVSESWYEVGAVPGTIKETEG